MRVEIFSDIVCPWCYVGERRFERALDGFAGADDVEVVFRPYQLDPNAPAEAIPHAEYMTRRFGAGSVGRHRQVDDAGADVGITFAWDRALNANTRMAHRLLMLAERGYGADVQRALAERLFELHFTRGGNIADADQLAAEAAEVGMDRARVHAYLVSDQGATELESEFASARALGIRAVPTFVFDGKWAIEGAQPAAKFLEALQEIERLAAVESTASAGCDSGACEV